MAYIEDYEESKNIYEGVSNKEDARYLLSYLNEVLIPASQDFFGSLDNNQLKLHQAFSFTTILAHAIDYILFISKKKIKIDRVDLVKNFDQRYAVDGCKHINNKFSLLDAVNNSFKHVELDPKRKTYTELLQIYGELSFNCIKEEKGKIFFNTTSYVFDYSRVVLRPIAAIFNCNLVNTNDVDDFINGRICGSTSYGSFSYDYEPHDAIDRMIDACSAECMDCGENGDNCDCRKFIYANNRGQYSPNIDPSFELNEVMSQIIGTLEWRKNK